MSDHKADSERDWWPCICGLHHQGKPRHAGAVTGAGLVMHAPLNRPEATGAEIDATCLGCLSDDLRHTCGFTDPLNPFRPRNRPEATDAPT